jgi:hypothetical protein
MNNDGLAERIENGAIPQNVNTLTLFNNKISDISPLSELTELEWLVLRNNNISSLEPLYELTNLRTLDLRENPAVTMAEINALQRELPFTIIHFTPTLGHILGRDEIGIGDALEILKFLAGMTSVITNPDSNAWNAALITSGSRDAAVPRIQDALEILKRIAGMDNVLA